MDGHNGTGKQNGKIAAVDAPHPTGYNGRGVQAAATPGRLPLSAREEALCQIIARIIARKVAEDKGRTE